MIEVLSNTINDITYYTRYNQIDKYEILDHDSRIVESGNTTITGYNGKIQHYILYNFIKNEIYTYKSYFLDDGVYYLATDLLLKSEDFTWNYISITKNNTFFNLSSSVDYNKDLLYYSRYSQIDKYEILDHNSRITQSGNTTITGYNGKILHSGLTFKTNNIYTYKSYYYSVDDDTYYLANQILIKDNYTEDLYTSPEITRTFTNMKINIVVTIIDGGSACVVSDTIIDGGSASSSLYENINGGVAC
jgi:hypothetical protein